MQSPLFSTEEMANYCFDVCNETIADIPAGEGCTLEVQEIVKQFSSIDSKEAQEFMFSVVNGDEVGQ